MLQRVFQGLVLFSALIMLGLVLFSVHRKKYFLEVYSRAPEEATRKPQIFRKVAENFWKLYVPGAKLKQAAPMKLCPNTPPDLVGPLHVEFKTKRTLYGVTQKVGSFLQPGGRYKPPNCVARQKVGQETNRNV